MASNSLAASEVDTINTAIGMLASKIEKIEERLAEVESALQGSGTYLGISDRQKLLDRLGALEEKEQLREEELRLLPAPPPPAASGVEIYRVKAKGNGTRTRAGIRGAVYMMAEKNLAYHEGTRERSISYPEAGGEEGSGQNDLEVSVVFKNEERAAEFQTQLGLWWLNQPLLGLQMSDIWVSPEIQRTVISQDALLSLERVMYSQYDVSAFDSPTQSLGIARRTSSNYSPPLSSVSVLSPVDPGSEIYMYQALEAPWRFAISNPYKCYLVPRADGRLRFDENNLVAATWAFHEQLDGVHTHDGVPGLLMIFVKGHEEANTPSQVPRYRVDVRIVCRTEALADTVGQWLKDGHTRIDHKQWECFVHVQDVALFRECLDKKSENTRRIWAKHDS